MIDSNLSNNFEYDQQKSKSNLEKHGIDFEQAQELWQDSELIEVSVKTTDEPRLLVVGKLNK